MVKVFQHHIPLSALAELVADGVFCFLAVLLAFNGLSATSFDAERAGLSASGMLLPAAGFALFMSLLYSLVGMYRHASVTVSMRARLGRAVLAVVIGSGIAFLFVNAEHLRDSAINLALLAMFYMVLGVVTVRLLFHAVRSAAVGSPRVLIVGAGAEALGVASDLRLPGRAQRSSVGF